jgi:hypothetical protein
VILTSPVRAPNDAAFSRDTFSLKNGGRQEGYQELLVGNGYLPRCTVWRMNEFVVTCWRWVRGVKQKRWMAGMTNIVSVMLLSLAASLASQAASAETLEGVYNTGPSRVEEAAGSSLNIIFHPCTDDIALICATVLETIEPNGPSGETMLPDGSPIVGYVMIKGLEARKPGKYRGGKILAVDESIVKGKMDWYGLRIDDNFDGTLTATGCLGFICPRKMIWTAVEVLSDPNVEP